MMMHVKKQTITAELTRLNLVLNARLSVEELRTLADVWYVDCNHMLEDRFLEAISNCRKKSKWFPAPSDIHREYNLLVGQVQDVPQIESGPAISPDEERDRMKKIRDLMSDQPTMYINKRYKPINPKGRNVIYVPEPFAENKRKLKLMR
jgi:hypothetical protein